MGRKQSGKRKHVYICLAGLMLLSACTTLVDLQERQEAQVHLREAGGLLARGDYEGSLRENLRVVSLAPNGPPADEALFNMGMIYVHPENPGRDYGKAVGLFRQVIEEYPRSPWVERAKILAGVFEGLENSKPAHVKEPPVDVKEPKEPKEAKEARELLRAAETLLAKGDYEGSLRENQRVMSLTPNRPPADEGLFNMAVIYAHPGNPKRDHGKAIALLRQLVKEYPQSSRVEQAKVWAGVLETFEKSKKVDIEIEEKRRDKAR